VHVPSRTLVVRGFADAEQSQPRIQVLPALLAEVWGSDHNVQLNPDPGVDSDHLLSTSQVPMTPCPWFVILNQGQHSPVPFYCPMLSNPPRVPGR